MGIKFTVTVGKDEFTDLVEKSLDYSFTGTSTFEGWERPSVPENFGIGLILGPSGSGKSLLLKEFGQEERPEWEPSKAIVSHFDTPNDAIDRLTSVGLNSIPSWCRPFHVLSNGEQFRANLARKLKDGAVIDEFTSVVDRNVAKAASNSVRRYVDRHDLKGLVFASCHYDILEWLRPDWYFDTLTGELHSGRLLRRPPINIKIYRCASACWRIFAKHHYLTPALNKASDCYLCTAIFGNTNSEVIVGFVSAISHPMMGNSAKFYKEYGCFLTKSKNGKLNTKLRFSAPTRKATREHRTVVLPDFQGMGIGPRISDAVAQFYLDQGRRYFSKTSHIRFGSYREKKGSGWIPTCKNLKERKDIDKKKEREQTRLLAGAPSSYTDFKGRSSTDDGKGICFSHEYIGRIGSSD